MKQAIIVTLVLGASLSAYGGKEERELMKNEVAPAVKDAEAKFKAACHCPLTIVIDPSIQSKGQLVATKEVAASISESSAGYCTDDGSRKAMCQLKTLKSVAGKETGFTFKGGVGIATTDGFSHIVWDSLTHELDK